MLNGKIDSVMTSQKKNIECDLEQILTTEKEKLL